MTESRRSSVWLRLAMRAYPRRWRATRETELLDVMRDSVPDRPHWPGVMHLLDLVIGGWRTRWRTHPPLWLWLGYRLVNRRLASTWRDWVSDDISGWWWWLRRSFPIYLLPLFLLVNSLIVPTKFSAADAVILVTVFSFVSLAFLPRDRRRARSRHLSDGPSPTPVWTWVSTWVPAPVRTRATPFLAGSGVALILGAPFAAWALLSPSRGRISQALSGGADQARLGFMFVSLSVAVGLGVACLLVACVVARRHLRDRLATRQRSAQLPRRLPAAVPLVFAAWQSVAEGAIVVCQRAEVIPGIVTLALVAAGLGIGPVMVGIAITARRSERSVDLDVTWRDCRLAILGSADVIAPEVGGYSTVPRVIRAAQL